MYSCWISDEKGEKLRCSVCTQYLCVPIQVLPDGKNICGDCIPSGCESPDYRNLSLEVLLNDCSFPCKYNGCQEWPLFTELKAHFATCGIQPFSCLAGECLWKGPIRLFLSHFTNNHSDQILPKAEFKLDVGVNEEIAMVAEGDVNFLLKYSYKAATCEFVYDIRHFKSVKEASCKIRVLNNLQTVPCRPYRFDFGNPQVSKTLSMLEADEIIVAIDFSFAPYDLLRCGRCKNYLAINVFDSEGEHICGSCCESNSRPSINEEIVGRVANSLIPCRWDNCGAVEKGLDIRKHEKECKYRLYRCIIPHCSDVFIIKEIDWHIKETHPEFQRCHRYGSTISFSKSFSQDELFYALCRGEFVLVESKTTSDTNEHPQQMHLKIKTTEYINNYRIKLVVKHPARRPLDCCGGVNKRFIINNEININADTLPECFKEGELCFEIKFRR